MTSFFRTNVTRTSPSQQIRKRGETMKSITLKSLVAVPALALVLGALSVATAADSPIEGGINGQIYEDSVQGVDRTWPYTPAEAEEKADGYLTLWKRQNPNCDVISEYKTFDWIFELGQSRPRCTINFTFEVLPWN